MRYNFQACSAILQLLAEYFVFYLLIIWCLIKCDLVPIKLHKIV